MPDSSVTHRDVLLVDDDDATRRLFEHVLVRAGLTVCSASDGLKGLEMLTKHHVDAIVLDLMMPRMTGFQVLERFAAERPELLRRTMVLSAASIEWVAKASLLPVWAVMRKPIDIDELLETVLDCLTQDATRAQKGVPAKDTGPVIPA